MYFYQLLIEKTRQIFQLLIETLHHYDVYLVWVNQSSQPKFTVNLQ